jgi:transcription-repair coupling factor (superfamily II helicase)
VGFDLYQRMLSEAIGELKVDSNITKATDEKAPDFEPKIEFPFDAYLPTDYVENSEHRLELYRKLSSVQDFDSIKRVTADTIDRYGTPPEQARSLFDLMELKLGCIAAQLPKLELKSDYLLAEFSNSNGEVWRKKLAMIVEKWHDQPIEFSGADPPHFIIRWDFKMNWNERIAYVKGLLKKIS